MSSYGREEDERRSRGRDDRGEGGRGSFGGGRDDGRRDSYGGGREDLRDSYSEDRRDDSRGRSAHRRDDNEDRSSSTSGYRGGSRDLSRDDEDRKPLHNEGEVQEAPMPGGWQVVEDSGVPSWDPDSLLQEPRPEGWSPPTPEPVPRTLVPFKESFETETPDPPRFDIADKETILRQNRDIDEREPLVVLNNLCVVRTHLRGIMDSKRRREEEDREEEREFRNNGFRERGGGRGGRGGRGGGRGRGRGRGGGEGFNGGREEGGDPNKMPVGERKRFGDDGDQNLLVRGSGVKKMEAAGSRGSGMRPLSPEERRPSSLRDRRLPSPRDKRPPSPRDRRPPSPRDRRPPSPWERRPPSPRERRPPSPEERRPPYPMSTRPTSPRDRRPPSPRDRGPLSPRDTRPPSPRDRRPASPSMESRYSRGTSPPSPKDRRKSFMEDFDRPRSPHRARDDPRHSSSHTPGRLLGDGDRRYATQGRGNVASSGTPGRDPAVLSTTRRPTGGSTPGTPGISSSGSGMTYKEWKERRAREKAAGQ